LSVPPSVMFGGLSRPPPLRRPGLLLPSATPATLGRPSTHGMAQLGPQPKT
jgi:hypothetical protein